MVAIGAKFAAFYAAHKTAVLAGGGATAVGGALVMRKRKAAASSSSPANAVPAGYTTAPGAAGTPTYDTTGTDTASYVGDQLQAQQDWMTSQLEQLQTSVGNISAPAGAPPFLPPRTWNTTGRLPAGIPRTRFPQTAPAAPKPKPPKHTPKARVQHPEPKPKPTRKRPRRTVPQHVAPTTVSAPHPRRVPPGNVKPGRETTVGPASRRRRVHSAATTSSGLAGPGI